MQEIIEETSMNNNQPVQSTKRVTTSRSTESTAFTAERVVYYIVGVVSSLLAFRFMLSLLGANRGNGFADFIYSVSYPLVAPFFGLFGYTMRYGISRFEIETLVAIAVYFVVGYGIAKLFSLGRRES